MVGEQNKGMEDDLNTDLKSADPSTDVKPAPEDCQAVCGRRRRRRLRFGSFGGHAKASEAAAGGCVC